ncbi:hypothetical protein [Psychromonas hadalis]|uniref:hypothetical protein n=1 Tax=Psychromonas hadalis TaxID=211669 RepID=UPI0003B79628|nr:hypothetical protein [Psychromonas hadalis]
MKYIILGITMLLSITWHWAQASNLAKNQYNEIKIQGKVIGLEGNVILKIKDNYLSLSPYERFTLAIQTTTHKNLIIQVINQPENQQCKLEKSIPTENIIRLIVSCQMMTKTTMTVAF